MSAIPLPVAFTPFSVKFPVTRSARAARPIGRGQSLAALRASELRDRFYSWRGASGATYVCSVFSLEEEALLGGFARGLLIGVAREGASRRPLCVLASRDFAGEAGCDLREAAQAQGLAEWHVHFCATDAEADDLAAGLAG
jgi:hypothetical protein